jgi:hypothetical protein
MNNLKLVIILIISIFVCNCCFSQGYETTMQFLLISPYTDANGMGETSVAIKTDDPLAPLTNPAHIINFNSNNYFSTGYNHGYRNSSYYLSKIGLQSYTFNTGINLSNFFDITPEINLGFGYSSVSIDKRELHQLVQYGTSAIGTFSIKDRSNQFTFGIGVQYWINLSGGLTFKHINSVILPIGTDEEKYSKNYEINSYDFGLLLNVPFIKIFEQIREKPIKIFPNISPIFNFNFGLAKNNLGDKEIIYAYLAPPLPLPHHARVGISFDIGITYHKGLTKWQPLSFKWTAEANDLLIREISTQEKSSGWEYQDGLGDIDFFDDVILGKTNSETIKKRGWELNLFEVFSLRGGYIIEDIMNGNQHYNTYGWGLSSSGIVKSLRAFNVNPPNNGFIGFLLNHCDLRYNHSKKTPNDLNKNLTDTRFHSVNFIISNIF